MPKNRSSSGSVRRPHSYDAEAPGYTDDGNFVPVDVRPTFLCPNTNPEVIYSAEPNICVEI